MLFREDFFKPTRLVSRNPFISERGLMPDNELLGATVTPKRAHFSQTGGCLSGLPLLYCHGPHLGLLPLVTLMQRRDLHPLPS